MRSQVTKPNALILLELLAEGKISIRKRRLLQATEQALSVSLLPAEIRRGPGYFGAQRFRCFFSGYCPSPRNLSRCLQAWSAAGNRFMMRILTPKDSIRAAKDALCLWLRMRTSHGNTPVP